MTKLMTDQLTTRRVYVLMIITIYFLCVSCNTRKACSEFREGTFQYVDKNRKEQVIRHSNIQVETNPETGAEIHTSVKWVSECTYILTFERFVNHAQDMDAIIGSHLVIDIINISGDKIKVHVQGGSIDEIVEMMRVGDPI